jgi:hypothetical protein
MKTKPPSHLGLLAACTLTLALSACATYRGAAAVEEKAAVTQAKTVSANVVASDKVTYYKQNFESNQDVQAPWLAGKSVALAKEVTVPAVLRRNVQVTTLQTGCTNGLNSFAACLSQILKLPVRVKPDALLPLTAFASRRSGGGQQQAAAAAPVVLASSTAPAATVRGAPVPAEPARFTINAVEMPINQLLDLADSFWSVRHKLADDGAIEFYRMETKTMRLKAMAQTLSANSKLETGFTASSETSLTIKNSDPVATMRNTLLSMGTLAGDVMVSPDTKAVVVTDTPESLAEIQRYLDEENRRLTRRVTLVVEELLVSKKDASQFALDWTLIYNRLSSAGVAATPNTFGSPASLTGANAAGIGLNIGGAKWAGSSLLINALNEQGLTVENRSYPISTLNGSPFSLGLPTIFDYVDKASNTVTSSGSGAITTPSISQKEDKIGSYLTVTPDAQDDGQIIVSLKFENRTGGLTPYTVGTAGNTITVQQRNIDEISTIGRTVLRVGVPTVFGGVSETSDVNKQRRLDVNAPILLGGSNNVIQSKRSLILLVTAIAEDGI